MRFKLAFLIFMALALGFVTSFAIAQNYQPAGDVWITKWWMLDKQVINTGGFAESGPHDWLSEGTGGTLSEEIVSTVEGLGKTATVITSLPDNGGDMGWKVITIELDSDYNMSIAYGAADDTNFDTYAIIVIDSPNARTTTMYPTHDDYAHIWVNGDKVYDNDQWTGGAMVVTTPTDIDLNAGENVLLFRCGESGGGDYFNLHLDASDTDLKLIPTLDDEFFDVLTPVEPSGKIGTWGGVK
jgi:hypothetical protein